MSREKIKEPVKMLAAFERGSLRPVAFEWHNRIINL
ncbi:hypothetical protein EDC14_1006108 [Hydrogenispora ethanolica]|jgi:hypothetical protein|uniref:Uncharacterized protein n=1 Tax=Hydrogenispora ethanolica TaxID=1082276 RepID=A0A4R1S000_HYDET|nr:hypothetical protein EDC14_1006108 [Hydrogenispora ethanolica]